MKVYLKHMNKTFDLTEEQTRLVDKAVDQLRHGKMLFQYAAPAGCGKSVVLHVIIQELGLTTEEVAPMAYMGSAAMIMRKHGFENAKTCHSWLFYAQKTKIPNTYDEEGNPAYTITWEPKELNPFISLVAIDEGSMIPMSIRKIIEENERPVIVCGDLDQLQPINDYPAYLTDNNVERLTQIMRQRQDSSIVTISDMLRRGERPRPGDYGEVLVIPFEEVNNNMLINAETILVGFNNTREDITNYIRSLLGYSGALPGPGEKVVCRENNWNEMCDDINLVNGLTGRCLSSGNSVNRMIDKDTFVMDFQPSLFPESIFKDIHCDYEYFVSDYVKRQDIKRFQHSMHAHKKRANKFEFGYALTTHMSQGNQYKNGIYFEQVFPGKFDQNKLNYTGITRFMDHCIYVLPRKKKLTFPPPSSNRRYPKQQVLSFV